MQLEKVSIELVKACKLEHQIRVCAEAMELRTKFNGLDSYINGGSFSSIDPDEQQRLKDQHLYMVGYYGVLICRMENF